jgi:DNA (cytosine-5)-methyltransferase 1
MTAYYNEIDPYAAQWLRNLIDARLIAKGDVDERDIREVRPGDLDGYTQCHFFAGIGGWSYALRLAGWPDDRTVWTGSCPCQPFSVASPNRKGFADERHLWPIWKELIAQRNPPVVFGEQVAKATDWLRLVRSDLEALEYAVGAMPIEAASANADHFRDRYWFVADYGGVSGQQNTRSSPCHEAANGRARRDECEPDSDHRYSGDGQSDNAGPLADSHSQRSQIPIGESSDTGAEFETVAGSGVCDVVDLARIGWGEGWTEQQFRDAGFTAAVAVIDGCQYIECPDGKWRRLPPPRVRWLGNGIPARVSKLRAFGNAIDPRPAAEFIRAYMEI